MVQWRKKKVWDVGPKTSTKKKKEKKKNTTKKSKKAGKIDVFPPASQTSTSQEKSDGDQVSQNSLPVPSQECGKGAQLFSHVACEPVVTTAAAHHANECSETQRTELPSLQKKVLQVSGATARFFTDASSIRDIISHANVPARNRLKPSLTDLKVYMADLTPEEYDKIMKAGSYEQNYNLCQANKGRQCTYRHVKHVKIDPETGLAKPTLLMRFLSCLALLFCCFKPCFDAAADFMWIKTHNNLMAFPVQDREDEEILVAREVMDRSGGMIRMMPRPVNCGFAEGDAFQRSATDAAIRKERFRKKLRARLAFLAQSMREAQRAREAGLALAIEAQPAHEPPASIPNEILSSVSSSDDQNATKSPSQHSGIITQTPVTAWGPSSPSKSRSRIDVSDVIGDSVASECRIADTVAKNVSRNVSKAALITRPSDLRASASTSRADTPFPKRYSTDDSFLATSPDLKFSSQNNSGLTNRLRSQALVSIKQETRSLHVSDVQDEDPHLVVVNLESTSDDSIKKLSRLHGPPPICWSEDDLTRKPSFPSKHGDTLTITHKTQVINEASAQVAKGLDSLNPSSESSVPNSREPDTLNSARQQGLPPIHGVTGCFDGLPTSGLLLVGKQIVEARESPTALEPSESVEEVFAEHYGLEASASDPQWDQQEKIVQWNEKVTTTLQNLGACAAVDPRQEVATTSNVIVDGIVISKSPERKPLGPENHAVLPGMPDEISDDGNTLRTIPEQLVHHSNSHDGFQEYAFSPSFVEISLSIQESEKNSLTSSPIRRDTDAECPPSPSSYTKRTASQTGLRCQPELSNNARPSSSTAGEGREVQGQSPEDKAMVEISVDVLHRAVNKFNKENRKIKTHIGDLPALQKGGFICAQVDKVGDNMAEFQAAVDQIVTMEYHSNGKYLSKQHRLRAKLDEPIDWSDCSQKKQIQNWNKRVKNLEKLQKQQNLIEKKGAEHEKKVNKEKQKFVTFLVTETVKEKNLQETQQTDAETHKSLPRKLGKQKANKNLKNEKPSNDIEKEHSQNKMPPSKLSSKTLEAEASVNYKETDPARLRLLSEKDMVERSTEDQKNKLNIAITRNNPQNIKKHRKKVAELTTKLEEINSSLEVHPEQGSNLTLDSPNQNIQTPEGESKTKKKKTLLPRPFTPRPDSRLGRLFRVGHKIAPLEENNVSFPPNHQPTKGNKISMPTARAIIQNNKCIRTDENTSSSSDEGMDDIDRNRALRLPRAKRIVSEDDKLTRNRIIVAAKGKHTSQNVGRHLGAQGKLDHLRNRRELDQDANSATSDPEYLDDEAVLPGSTINAAENVQNFGGTTTPEAKSNRKEHGNHRTNARYSSYLRAHSISKNQITPAESSPERPFELIDAVSVESFSCPSKSWLPAENRSSPGDYEQDWREPVATKVSRARFNRCTDDTETLIDELLAEMDGFPCPGRGR